MPKILLDVELQTTDGKWITSPNSRVVLDISEKIQTSVLLLLRSPKPPPEISVMISHIVDLVSRTVQTNFPELKLSKNFSYRVSLIDEDDSPFSEKLPVLIPDRSKKFDPDFYKVQTIINKMIDLTEYLGISNALSTTRTLKNTSSFQTSSELKSEAIFASEELEIRTSRRVNNHIEIYNFYIDSPQSKIQIIQKRKNMETGSSNITFLWDKNNSSEDIPEKYTLDDRNSGHPLVTIQLTDLFGGDPQSFPDFSFGKKILEELQNLVIPCDSIENTTLDSLNIEAKKEANEVTRRMIETPKN